MNENYGGNMSRRMRIAVAASLVGMAGVMGTGTANAFNDKPKPSQPAYPPGWYAASDSERPADLEPPSTGRQNSPRF
jgi:hypothetical protein